MADTRFQLVWEKGLCFHGCGEPVTRPGNRFINGHDGMLMDLLVDAHRAGIRVEVRGPSGAAGHGVTFDPRMWASKAFSPSGLRHFEWLLTQPGGERPATSHTEVPPGYVVVRSPEEIRAGDEVHPVLERAVSVEELENHRVAAWVGPTQVQRVADLEQENARLMVELANALEDLEEVRALADLTEAECARQLEVERLRLEEAVRPVIVSADEVASLSVADLVTALRARIRAAALVFDAASYEGDASEVWDLYAMFRPGDVDEVSVAAARALLGQGVGGL